MSAAKVSRQKLNTMEEKGERSSAPAKAGHETNQPNDTQFFEDVCDNLNLDKETRNKAQEFLSKLPPKSQGEQSQVYPLEKII